MIRGRTGFVDAPLAVLRHCRSSLGKVDCRVDDSFRVVVGKRVHQRRVPILILLTQLVQRRLKIVNPAPNRQLGDVHGKRDVGTLVHRHLDRLENAMRLKSVA